LSARQSFGPDDTEAAGAELAARLAPGDVVLVAGELGAGKTTFVRGACRALGVTDPVQSPTFTIGRRYRGRVPVSHLDLYRLEDLSSEAPGLLDDYLTGDAITFVEWPGRGEAELDRVAARVTIEHAGGDRRLIAVEG
jgi:tRNA threonylcarbamoyladenosine biosynthesis protein TsaE